MILYIVRHGEPNYEIDSLTPAGFEMAEKLGQRLKSIKFDRIYVSSHGRCKDTARPTIETHPEVTPIYVDWAREDLGAKYYIFQPKKGLFTWYYVWPKWISKFRSEKLLKLGNNWIKDKDIKKTKMPEGYKLMSNSVDSFMLECGYKHDRNKHCYIKVGNSPEKVLIVAHGGFLNSFLSNLLDVPYPEFSTTHVQVGYTSITEVAIEGDKAFPTIIKFNDTNHIDNM